MEQVYWNYKIHDDWELPGTARRTHQIEDVIIPGEVGCPPSNAVDLRGYGTIGLVVPDLDNLSDLTFYVSETEAGVYRIVNNSDGTPWTIVTGAGDRVIDTDGLAGLGAYRWVKIVPTVEQNAERILHFLVKG